MDVILVLGGARSGKSSYAEARAIDLGGTGVTYVATATVSDDDMRDRIARHRAMRPPDWETIENVDAAEAVRAAKHAVVILDCLTLLLARQLGGLPPEHRSAVDAACDAAVSRVIKATAARAGTLLVVSNEVGMSIHPTTASGLWFQDALGRANQRLAAEARQVVLLVAGIPMVIKGAPE